MMNTSTTTVPALPKPPVTPLNVAETYSLSSTNYIPSRNNTNLNATANLSQPLYQPQTAPNLGPFASFTTSIFVPNVHPKNFSSSFTQDYTVPFVAMIKTVRHFDGIDHDVLFQKIYINMMHKLL